MTTLTPFLLGLELSHVLHVVKWTLHEKDYVIVLDSWRSFDGLKVPSRLRIIWWDWIVVIEDCHLIRA
jgi:hypothetical protein